MALVAGTTIGAYRVARKLGGGAMGGVYLATHSRYGTIALKVIHPELAEKEEMLSRFFTEARAVSTLGHPHITNVVDYGQTPDGDSYIAMELLEGITLGDRIKLEERIAMPSALHIARQIADGLAAAHARGIVHRDLKPDNVFLVDRNGDPEFVKILDFGLAKLTTGSGPFQHKTQSGSVLGTPHYMAPEQCEGREIDHRVDIYALGCIMYQMMTGQVPFPGDGFGEVLIKHLREPPPPPSRINPEITHAVEKLILLALAKKKEFRFQTMADFSVALRDPDRFVRALEGDALSNATFEMLAPQIENESTPPSIHHPAGDGPRVAAIKSDAFGATVKGASSVVDAEIARRAADSGERKKQENSRLAPTDATLNDEASGLSLKFGDEASEQPQSGLRGKRATSVRKAAARATPEKARGGHGAILWITIAMVVLGVGAGVAAMVLRPGEASLLVTSDPVGAEVVTGGAVVGHTPVVVKVTAGQPASLIVRRDGFVDEKRDVPAGMKTLDVKLVPVPRPMPPRSVADPPPAATPPASPPRHVAPKAPAPSPPSVPKPAPRPRSHDAGHPKAGATKPPSTGSDPSDHLLGPSF